MIQVRNDPANSFLNTVAAEEVTQETVAKIRNDGKTRRIGRQEAIGVVYPHYIHIADGKLWNEATV